MDSGFVVLVILIILGGDHERAAFTRRDIQGKQGRCKRLHMWQDFYHNCANGEM